jgi:hypothetical protein
MGIVGDLFRADAAEHFRALQCYSELEITSLDAPPDAGEDSLLPLPDGFWVGVWV